MTVFLCVSATESEAAALEANGPRRDFVELQRETAARLFYRRRRAGRGLRSKLFGPHIQQAWEAARHATGGDVVFADGEHVGLPLVAFLSFRRRKGVRVVLLGHFLDRQWKLWPIRVLSRFGPRTTLVVHSLTQAAIVAPCLGKSWKLSTVPYQVDTAFWRTTVEPDASGVPILLAVGSEHRDYETLVEATRDLPISVRIAAGSHWARRIASVGTGHSNVEYLDRALSFGELREAYEEATAVVVPVVDVTNQSGVTTILEAMSMGRAVITSANRGQREYLVGATMTSTGAADPSSLADRGPHLFAGGPPSNAATGWYTPVGDAKALRAAIIRVINDPAHARALGDEGRRTVCGHFTLDAYVSALRDLIIGEHRTIEGRA